MYQRKRAVTACQPCRLRKTRCDNVRPICGFCSKNGAQCTYPEANNGDYSTFVLTCYPRGNLEWLADNL